MSPQAGRGADQTTQGGAQVSFPISNHLTHREVKNDRFFFNHSVRQRNYKRLATSWISCMTQIKGKKTTLLAGMRWTSGSTTRGSWSEPTTFTWSSMPLCCSWRSKKKNCTSKRSAILECVVPEHFEGFFFLSHDESPFDKSWLCT